jgi:D-arabinose 1-dehydrogenase-like Zn-dependent alcohol dehydrogenase
MNKLTPSRLVSLMATGGAIYPLTVDKSPSGIPLYLMNHNGVKIQGTLVASRQTMQELMEFVAEHGVRPTINTFPLTKEGIETAIEKLGKGEIRYRAVLVNGI